MGYTVLHMEKASGNDAGMSAHIERTIHPKNANEKRTHLNRELVEFPNGIKTRTHAIQHRLDTAGLKRKIGTNQVRAIRIMLSGTHEDMKHIEKSGKLNKWCNDNMDWLKQTFGEKNLVSAVLHMDEKTPHIHATVVPIVTGERRKARKEEQSGKKKYRKKDCQSARLCADDLMAREKLKEYQNTYAISMQKYSLQRGIEGSEAKHISTQQFYRDLFVQKEELQEDVKILLAEEEEMNESIRYLYDQKDEARDKYWSMDKHVKAKTQELETINSKLEKVRQEYEPYKAQEDLNRVFELHPIIKEHLRMATLCEAVGFTFNAIKKLLTGVEMTVTGSLFSPEHKQSFNIQDAKAKIDREPSDQNKLRLTINGTNILDWFKQKFRELQEAFSFRKQPEPKRSQGIKM